MQQGVQVERMLHARVAHGGGECAAPTIGKHHKQRNQRNRRNHQTNGARAFEVGDMSSA